MIGPGGTHGESLPPGDYYLAASLAPLDARTTGWQARSDSLASLDAGIEIRTPNCPADFNRDGVVNPDDLSDFVTCFFLDVLAPGTCPRADDGSRDPDDLSDFITVFFTAAGC